MPSTSRQHPARIAPAQIRARSSVDFQLDIPGLGIIACRRILRGVSGKRLLCLGEHGEVQYILKLFFDPRRARKHWQQSTAGSRLFAEQGIDTPELIFAGYLPESGLYCLVLSYLDNALSIKELLSTPEPETGRQERILKSLFTCIAEQQARGIWQQDLNLGNFLVHGEKIFAIDGDHVLKLSGPLSKRRSLDSLASMFVKLDRFVDIPCEPLFAQYARTRDWVPSQRDQKRLLARIRHRKAFQALKQFVRRLRRSTQRLLGGKRD